MAVPETIQNQMRLKGIKSIRALAIKSKEDPKTIHRMFSGENQHKSLMTYKRIAEALHWSLERLFYIAEGNDPKATGEFIRARLRQLNISPDEFALKVHITGKGANGYAYLRGDIGFDRLRVYSRICTTLGITGDALYESLVMSGSLTGTPITAILPSSVTHNLVETKLAA